MVRFCQIGLLSCCVGCLDCKESWYVNGQSFISMPFVAYLAAVSLVCNNLVLPAKRAKLYSQEENECWAFWNAVLLCSFRGKNTEVSGLFNTVFLNVINSTKVLQTLKLGAMVLLPVSILGGKGSLVKCRKLDAVLINQENLWAKKNPYLESILDLKCNTRLFILLWPLTVLN